MEQKRKLFDELCSATLNRWINIPKNPFISCRPDAPRH
jgi:hypothetical protein